MNGEITLLHFRCIACEQPCEIVPQWLKAILPNAPIKPFEAPPRLSVCCNAQVELIRNELAW